MRKQDGFTLIELLVVIAIIALLLAILMPALQRVKKQAETVACKANLHEWALVLVMYTDDNDGLLMDGYGGGIDGTWVGGLRDYYQEPKIRVCPTATKPMSEGARGAAGYTRGDRLARLAWRAQLDDARRSHKSEQTA